MGPGSYTFCHGPITNVLKSTLIKSVFIQQRSYLGNVRFLQVIFTRYSQQSCCISRVPISFKNIRAVERRQEFSDMPLLPDYQLPWLQVNVQEVHTVIMCPLLTSTCGSQPSGDQATQLRKHCTPLFYKAAFIVQERIISEGHLVINQHWPPWEYRILLV